MPEPVEIQILTPQSDSIQILNQQSDSIVLGGGSYTSLSVSGSDLMGRIILTGLGGLVISISGDNTITFSGGAGGGGGTTVIADFSGYITTGHADLRYYSITNPNNYVNSGNTGNLTNFFVPRSESGRFYDKVNVNNYSHSGNLYDSGVILRGLINTLSGNAVLLFSDQTVMGTKRFNQDIVLDNAIRNVSNFFRIGLLSGYLENDWRTNTIPVSGDHIITKTYLDQSGAYLSSLINNLSGFTSVGGTSGYIPKFTNTGLVNSNIFDSGTSLYLGAPTFFSGGITCYEGNSPSSQTILQVGNGSNGFKIISSFGTNSAIDNFACQRSDSTAMFGANITNFIVRGGVGFGATSLASIDTSLNRDSAGILAQRNGTAGQVFRVYNSTGTNSGEYAQIGWTGNNLLIGSLATQSGLLRDVIITGNNIYVNPSGIFSVFGSRLVVADNANAVTTNGNFSAASFAVYPYFAVNYPTQQFSLSNSSAITWDVGTDYLGSKDVWLKRGGTGTLRLSSDGSNKEVNLIVNGHFAATGGNVGINTTTPTCKLDVSGLIRGENIVTSGYFSGSRMNWGNGQVYTFENSSDPYVLTIRFNGTSLGSISSIGANFPSYYINGWNALSFLRPNFFGTLGLYATGIGINTTIPQCALDVSGQIKASGLHLVSAPTGLTIGTTTGDWPIALANTIGNKILLGKPGSNEMSIDIPDVNTVRFNTNGQFWFNGASILSGFQRLDLSSTAANLRLYDITDSTSLDLAVRKNSFPAGAYVYSAQGGGLFSDTNWGDLVIGSPNSALAKVWIGRLNPTIFSNSGILTSGIQTSGNVGINNRNPQASLDVSGNIIGSNYSTTGNISGGRILVPQSSFGNFYIANAIHTGMGIGFTSNNTIILGTNHGNGVFLTLQGSDRSATITNNGSADGFSIAGNTNFSSASNTLGMLRFNNSNGTILFTNIYSSPTGIGLNTTNPQSLLDISGNILASGIAISNASINRNLNLAPSGLDRALFNLDTKPFYVYNGLTTSTGVLPSLVSSTGRTYFIKNRGATLTLSGQFGEYLFSTAPVINLSIASGEAYIIANGGQYWDVM